LKFAPMAIPAMALLQQHNVQRDILIEPVAWRHGGVQRSKLGGIPKWGHSELGVQSGHKNQPACLLSLLLLPFYGYINTGQPAIAGSLQLRTGGFCWSKVQQLAWPC